MQTKVKLVAYVDALPSDGTTDIPVEDVKQLAVPQPTIRTPYNSRYFAKNQEVNTEPSLTVPDEAMTVIEILKRYASGLPINGGKVPLYEENGDMPDYSELDLAERQVIIEQYQQEIKEITERVNKRRAVAQEKRMEQVIRERLAKEAKENPTDSPTPNPPTP